jgi:acylphosphatase
MLIQRYVKVVGKVQGVSFRAWIFEKVARCGFPIRGYVKNLRDGSVEAVFLGEDVPVLALVASCQAGPDAATVTDLHVEEQPLAEDLQPFQILR